MTDNPKAKTGKTVHNDAKVPVHTLRSDVNTSLHQLEDAGVKAKKVSDAKTAAAQDKLKHAAAKDHKGSDAKIAPHKTVAKVNKK
jgi:Ethanolamine utilization protein EutJ (predicted chaperonin)